MENTAKSCQDGFSDELMEHLFRRKHAELKECLIGMDCPSKVIDSEGATLLHHAAGNRNVQMTQYFLDIGFQVDHPDYEGCTPLTWAVRTGNDETADLLIKHGADIYNDARDKSGWTVLQWALRSQSERIIKIFLHKLRRDNPTNEALAEILHNNLVATLHPVIYLRNAEVTRLLLKKGHSPTGIFQKGITCLNLAIELSDIENVKVLIEHGIDVNAPAPSGLVPVDSIPICNKPQRLEIMKLLIDNGADFSIRRSGIWFKETQIHVMFQYGTRDMVRLLFQTHRDFIIKNMPTLLCCLALNRYESVIDEITVIPYNVNSRIRCDNTALDYAVSKGRVKAIEFLLSEGAEVDFSSELRQDTALVKLIRSKHTPKSKMQRLKLLLEYGADPQRMFLRRDYMPTTPLIEAVLANELCVAKALLAHIVLRERFLQQAIMPETLKTLEIVDRLKRYFRLCKKHVEIMDKTNICGSVTLLNLLTKDVSQSACRVKNQNLKSEVTRVCKKYNFISHYCSLLQRRSTEILNVVTLKRDAAIVYDNIFGHLYNQNHLVIGKIVSFISCEDLRNVLQARNTRLE